MNTNYKYTLEPYKGMQTRFTCPNCGNRNTFARYIDTDTNNYIADYVGKCNRVDKCRYHSKPKEYFINNGLTNISYISYKPQPIINNKPDYIDLDILQESLLNYQQNKLFIYLNSLYGLNKAFEVMQRYYLGTSNLWNGATIFWQIDESLQIRTGKIMLYDEVKGKRVKEPYNHFSWVHKKINKPDFNLKQCLFGLHLINDNEKPIAIVESEKTALICSIINTDFIWLATGGMQNLRTELFKPLKGRNVTLFPDLGGFEEWKVKAEQLYEICNIKVSDILENIATETELNEGFDLADYLTRKN